MSKVIVVGGGPAGMMSAITAAENGHDVLIIEKMPTFGKKLLITGKGRCNITSSLYMSDFIKNTPGNGKFLYSAFQNYTNNDIIEFLKKQGLEVKEERGNRIFPVTDKSIDVLNCFVERMKALKIKQQLNTTVEKTGKTSGVSYRLAGTAFPSSAAIGSNTRAIAANDINAVKQKLYDFTADSLLFFRLTD